MAAALLAATPARGDDTESARARFGRSSAAGGAVTTLIGPTAGFVDGSACVAKLGALEGITCFAGSLYAVDVERIRTIVLP